MGEPEKGEARVGGVSGRDGTGVRCGSAGVEYPKDYGWLNVTKALTGSELLPAPSRGAPCYSGGLGGNLAISEANKAPAQSSDLTAVQRYGSDPRSLPGS